MAHLKSSNFWRVVQPSKWPQIPPFMSYSTLIELEECPLRWAYLKAEYLEIDELIGYPEVPRLSTLNGTIIHLCVCEIVRELDLFDCSSLTDENAINALKNLGGFSKIIIRNIDIVISQYVNNPRIIERLDQLRGRLVSNLPDLRIKIQNLLSHLYILQRTNRSKYRSIHRTPGNRKELQNGSYFEVYIMSKKLKWHGIADMISISSDICEIRDFKSGAMSEEHKKQLQIYALLWTQDFDLNPSCRLPNKLIIAYNEKDVEISQPDNIELALLEQEIVNRTEIVLSSLQSGDPPARPSKSNCSHCTVRHLCETYWMWLPTQSSKTYMFDEINRDLQIRIISENGYNSWNGVVEIGTNMKPGDQILLRDVNAKLTMKTGEVLRIMDVFVNSANIGEDKTEEVFFPNATIGIHTEVFVMRTN